MTPFESLRPADAVILAVAHKDYVAGGWSLVAKLLKGGQGIVLDVKSRLDRAQEARRDRPVAAIEQGSDDTKAGADG